MNNLKNILYFEIKPGVGIGEITLGMTAEEIIKKYATTRSYYTEKNFEIGAYYPDIYYFNFFNSVKLFVDIKTSLLVEIRLENQFSSQFMKSIGIGDKVGALRSLRQDLSYDDEGIMIGDDWGLIMVADDDLMSLSDDEIDNCSIESMIIKKFAR